MDTEPRAGSVQISAKIESQFARGIYGQFERMMNHLYTTLNLNYDWRFRMFGNIFTDEEELETCRKGLTLGLLSETLKYNALMGHSTLEDLSMSNAILGVGIMECRVPLSTSYTMSGKNFPSGMAVPGQTKGTQTTVTETESESATEEGGRPEAGDNPGTESQESSQDAGN